MKNDPVERALAILDGADTATPEGRQRLIAGLRSKYNFVAAKAARIIESHGPGPVTAELASELEKSLAVKLGQPAAADKGCTAKIAIARALVQLEHDAPDLFARGIAYVQKEPSWGETIDTAPEFRAVCAMGLVNGFHREKLRLLLPVLVEREWQARAGAVRALGVEASEAAALLLRFKAITGDEHPDVLFECYSALIAAEGPAAIPFIDGFCDAVRDEVAENAMLALGASRRTDALTALIERYETRRNPRLVKSLLLAIASSRTDTALDRLTLIADAAGIDSAAARSAIESCWPASKRLAPAETDEFRRPEPGGLKDQR